MGSNMLSDIYFRLLLNTINNDPCITEKPKSYKELSLGKKDTSKEYFFYLVDFYYRHDPQSNVGLRFGKNIVALNLCDFFRMITSAETVEDFLSAAVSIYHTLGLTPYPVVYRGPKVSSLAIAFPYQESTKEYSRRFTSEVFFSYGLDLFKESVSVGVDTIQLFLDYPKPEYADEYQSLFNCDIIYDAPISMVEFPSYMLSAPMPNQNKPLHKVYIEKTFEKWSNDKRDQSFRYRAITQLMNHSSHNFSSANLASEMNISTRGLQKRLASEGSSYSLVCKQVRRELAKICLFQKEMEVEETAKNLGFQTQVSFRKFFKEQFGGNPSRGSIRARGAGLVS
jgi:AraC-like DNA-binding protein